MAGPNLPTNRSTATSIADHVSDHNAAHNVVNKFDKDAIPAAGDGFSWDSVASVYLPMDPAATNIKRFGAILNGTGDNTSAFTAAAGKTVFFPPGTYRLANTAFISLSANTRWFALPGTVTFSFEGTAPEVFRTDGSDIVFEGINFVRAANTTGILVDVRGGFSRFTMRHCFVNGARDVHANSWHAFKVGVSNFDTMHVYDTTITKCHHGLVMSTSDTATVTDIVFADCVFNSQYSTDLEFNSPNGSITDVTVRSCVFKDNQRTTSGGGWAVGLAHVARVSIRDCTIKNYFREALHIEDLSENVSVESSRFITCGKNDFSYIEVISNSVDIRIANNTFDARANNNGTAIPIIDIHFTAGTTPGGRTAASPERITITGNTILASTVNTASIRGIYLEDSIDVTVTGNILVGTGAVSAGVYTGTQESAFYILGGKDLVFTGNIVKGWLNGFRPSGSGSISSHGGMIANNVFRDCRIGVGALGIGASVITGNMIYNCVKPLITGTGSSTGAYPVIVTGNHAYGCTEPMRVTDLTSVYVPVGATTQTVGTGKTLTVSALDRYLPSGTVLTFTGGGVITLTTAANTQATSIIGDVTVASITDDETATLLLPYSTVGAQDHRLISGNAENVAGGIGYTHDIDGY